MLPERFEEYLNLLDVRKTLTDPQEQAELMPRLQACFLSLREAVEQACVRHGVNFEELIAKAEAEVTSLQAPHKEKTSHSRLKKQGRKAV